MIAQVRTFHTVAVKHHRVADLMRLKGVDLDDLESHTGLDRRVIEAIAHQRYTPSAEQRMRVSGVLGVRSEQIMWGHATPVQEYIHGPT